MIEKMEPCQTKKTLGRCNGTDFSISEVSRDDKTVTRKITCNKCRTESHHTVSLEPLIEDKIIEGWNTLQKEKAEV